MVTAVIDRLLKSVLAVRSTDSTNPAFGTAYAIKHDDTTTYLATCAHVVRDVGGETKVRIERQPAGIVAYGSPEGADDVAVLRTGRLDVPSLPLAFDAEPGRRVYVLGFRPIQTQSGLLAAMPIKATLGTVMALESPHGRSRPDCRA